MGNIYFRFKMISKSLRNVLNKNIGINQKGLIATQKRNMGGAKPPPNISSSMFGWEMLKVEKNALGEKIATFKNVDTSEVIEKPFWHANINPTSKPHAELVEAGI